MSGYENEYKEAGLETPNVFEIDSSILDEEWVQQPKLYYKFAAKLADARREADELLNTIKVLKEEAGITKAELDSDIRNNPTKYDIVKITETAVLNAVTSHKRMKEHSIEIKSNEKVLISAKHRIGILEAATSALDHKKKALENLVYLQGQNYFSSPQAKSPKDKEVMGNVDKTGVRRRFVRTPAKEEA